VTLNRFAFQAFARLSEHLSASCLSCAPNENGSSAASSTSLRHSSRWLFISSRRMVKKLAAMATEFPLIVTLSSCFSDAFRAAGSSHGDVNGFQNLYQHFVISAHDLHHRNCLAREAKTLRLHVDNLDESLAAQCPFCRRNFNLRPAR
jgi:hypothetical protein